MRKLSSLNNLQMLGNMLLNKMKKDGITNMHYDMFNKVIDRTFYKVIGRKLQ